MSNLDLSGVDPLRWAEVRRRVQVITSYLEIPQPNDNDRKEYASKLDLRVRQFLTLVRAWRLHKRASALAGSGAAKGHPRATGPRHLPNNVKAEAKRIIDELGSDATLKEAKLRIAASLEAKGWQVPSNGTIHNMLARKRQDRCANTDDDAIIVGRCLVELPTQVDEDLIYPTVLLAVGASSGAVLAAATAVSSQPKCGARVFDALGPTKKVVLVDATMCPPDLDLPSASAVDPAIARSHLSRVLGFGIGSLRLIYRPRRQPDRLLRSSFDKAMSAEDAEDFIRSQLKKHNGTRGAADPAWLATS